MTHFSMDSIFYYRLLENPEPVGTIINTDDRFNGARLSRYLKLKDLFRCIFDVSKLSNVSVHYILSQVYPDFFRPETELVFERQLLDGIDKIRIEIDRTNFVLQSEFRYFNDFVLDMVHSDLSSDSVLLPDRFKSHYFFLSVQDCVRYYLELPNSRSCTVIEVELVEMNYFSKHDNSFLTNFENYFTASDFYNQAKKFLLGEVSRHPLIEIVFQGIYRVRRHVKKMP